MNYEPDWDKTTSSWVLPEYKNAQQTAKYYKRYSSTFDRFMEAKEDLTNSIGTFTNAYAAYNGES